MLPAQVAESYDRIAARWASPSFDRSQGMAQHKRALGFTSHRGAALDVGCGSSGRFLDLFGSEGFAAEGLDISSEMLRLAREAYPQFTFHQADICDWTAQTSYDFISAWDSIWHVPLPKQHYVLLKLCAALSIGGATIFTAGGVETPGEVQDAHMGLPMYHASLGVARICAYFSDRGRPFQSDRGR